ncbi:peptidylprolyl isomerase [Pseudomonadota bacterium]
MKKFTTALLFVCVGLFSSLVAASDDKPRVLMETNMGSFTLELDAKAAPKTVENFIRYVEEEFYDHTIFHRVIKDFMIQGGGFYEGMQKKLPHAPIKNEANNGLKNLRGTIAMARAGDPDSATAQFFINTVDNKSLDYTAPNTRGWGYAVFGQVVEGMETVDKIRAVRTTMASGYRDVPVQSVIIKRATLVK